MNWRVLIASAVLVVALGGRMWLSATPVIPSRTALSDFPRQMGDWTLIREDSLSDPIMGVLKADDYLVRTYRNQAGNSVSVFIAYYSAQHAGESMHSPKNCLPGSGWQPIQNDQTLIPVGKGQSTASVNRYVVEKNGEHALVLYWYQAHGRVIASELSGKLYMVWDALRLRRRDGAIVRFTVPMRSSDPESAMKAASDLAKVSSGYLPKFLPN